ncbi:MAG: AAA family ATPase [Lachnospirales bacterium]
MIITISRETGSGGHTVGEMLAERLGYDFYDKEIVDAVAKDMNLDKAVILENGENMSDKTYLDIASGFIPFSRREKVPFDEIKKAQDRLIKKIASKDNCVIVGRGANDVLKDYKNAFHIFIHADMNHRIERVQRHENVYGHEKRIKRELQVKDRSRSMYYNYFTGKEWGKVENYNLSIDTSIFTKTQSVELIITAINMIKEEKENA